MTKTEQVRLTNWRFKVLQRAADPAPWPPPWGGGARPSQQQGSEFAGPRSEETPRHPRKTLRT